jgi:hypothetical protein
VVQMQFLSTIRGTALWPPGSSGEQGPFAVLRGSPIRFEFPISSLRLLTRRLCRWAQICDNTPCSRGIRNRLEPIFLLLFHIDGDFIARATEVA